MELLRYPNRNMFPTVGRTDIQYLAEDTGEAWYYNAGVGTAGWKVAWPNSASKRDYQKPGIIGSNRQQVNQNAPYVHNV